MNFDRLYTLCDAETDKYTSIRGIYVYPDRKYAETDVVGITINIDYRYSSGTIPYKENVPAFWLNMSDEFVSNNCQTMIRNLIKASFSVEVERIFGWKYGGFNPL